MHWYCPNPDIDFQHERQRVEDLNMSAKLPVFTEIKELNRAFYTAGALYPQEVRDELSEEIGYYDSRWG